jgi:hypothetical protein
MYMFKNIFIAFIFFIFAIAYSNTVRSQRLVFLYGHAVYASPVDKNFNHQYKFGGGAEGGVGVGWNKTFLVGTIGYSYFESESGTEAGNVTYVPFKAGVRHYLLSKLLYIHGDLGIGRVTYKNIASTQSRLSGDIGAGVKFGPFEAQLDYDGFSRSDPSGYASWIGIKAGFSFGL